MEVKFTKLSDFRFQNTTSTSLHQFNRRHYLRTKRSEIRLTQKNLDILNPLAAPISLISRARVFGENMLTQRAGGARRVRADM